MTRNIHGDIKYLILSLLIISGISSSLYSQRKISGVINKYASVSTLDVDNVTISDEAQFDQFTPGDTVLLMQMKGVRVLVQEAGSFGTFEYNYGVPGLHEFLIIESIDDGANRITFRNNIVHSDFHPGSALQLIKVPSYNFAEVDATLTCQPWDSITKTGGVLAAIVSRALSLKADINVTGKGFLGGNTTLGKGICAEQPGMYEFAYSALSDSAGLKGESPASRGWVSLSSFPPIYPTYARGKGSNFSGGGGGNGRFSGGGGGGNYGAGGVGGKEQLLCTFEYNGGLGGLQTKGTYLANTLKSMFMGSGGGASTYITGGNPTAGANGGGVVILVCDTVRGNGNKILAEGGTPSATASGNAGAGGGGGGGTIGLYLQSYSSNLATSGITLSVNGGKGGNTSEVFGEGGGGGGGLITTNNIALPSNGSKTISGGTGGIRSPSIPGNSGYPGENLTSFAPVLNGFLFNSIRSSVTGTQIDSICSDTPLGEISGTKPIGGTTPYTYLWEFSVTSETDNFSPAPGINNQQNYTPPDKLTQTTWFRRIVTDANATPLVDISKTVKIIVHQAITGNLVGNDTTICYNQDPLLLVPLNSGPSNGNGIYQYQWLANNDNSTWTTAATGISTSGSYDPPALTSTTYYKRYVTSGRCISYSPTVTVTVLPSITNNIITPRPDSVICQGSLFSLLPATIPLNGAGPGTYIYQWQDSTTSGTWQPAAGVNTGQSHLPDTARFSSVETRYFRRVVYSGPDNVCQSASTPIQLTRYFNIMNNNIAADNTICSGSVPASLTGSTPTRGDGTYTYTWQQSDDGSTWTSNASGDFNLINYSPPALTDSTWYRRIVNSSKCTDASNIVVINVHKPLSDNNVSFISGTDPDTTICSGAVPNRIKGSLPSGGTDLPGDYAYQWLYSTDNVTYDNVSGSGTFIDYQPGTLTATTWFKRRTISGMCSSESNAVRIIVLPQITDNVISSSKATVCFNQIPVPLTGTGLTGGAGGTPKWLWQQSINGSTWTAAAGTNDQQNYSPPALTTKTWYRRIVLSGPADCCSSTSNTYIIDIDQLPTGTITSISDTTICNGGQVKLRVNLTGASKWTLVYNENSELKTVSNILSGDTIISATPAATGSMTLFNYSLNSLTDNNGCIATSLTGTRKANVYRVPIANAGPDDQICGPEYTLAAIPSDGTGTWTFPAQVVSSVAGDPNTTVKIDSSFTTASVSYKFYWEEINWQCRSKDSVTISFFNRIDTINAGRDSAFMSFDYLVKLNAYPIQPYESGKWSVVTGSGDFDDDTQNVTDVRNVSLGLNTYKWRVTNGPCLLEDLVNMDVNSVVIPEAISPNGDNINDSLIIRGLDLANQEAELTIVNGAGTMVFSTSNRGNNTWKNWDGKNSQGVELPEGTYYFLLKVISVKTGLVVPTSGFVILKRN